jgi:lipoic acid synthetase
MSHSDVVREAQDVVRDAQSTDNLRRQRQAEGGRQAVAHSRSRFEPGEILKKPDWIRVKAGSPDHALL